MSREIAVRDAMTFRRKHGWTLPGGPLVVEVPLLGRVGDVAGVKKQAQDQCLVKTGEFTLRPLT